MFLYPHAANPSTSFLTCLQGQLFQAACLLVRAMYAVRQNLKLSCTKDQLG